VHRHNTAPACRAGDEAQRRFQADVPNRAEPGESWPFATRYRWQNIWPERSPRKTGNPPSSRKARKDSAPGSFGEIIGSHSKKTGVLEIAVKRFSGKPHELCLQGAFATTSHAGQDGCLRTAHGKIGQQSTLNLLLGCGGQVRIAERGKESGSRSRMQNNILDLTR